MVEKAGQENEAAVAVRKQRGHILYTHGEKTQRKRTQVGLSCTTTKPVPSEMFLPVRL